MAVYVIIDISIHNREVYMQYVDRVRSIVERHGGRYLARGGTIVPLSPGWSPERVILIEFPSREHVERWFQSPEYRAVAPLREQSTTCKAIIVEGEEKVRGAGATPGIC